MKAVLVGNIDGKKLYYILDCKSRFGDGILASNQNDAQIVDFWPTVNSAEMLIPITNTLFHESLWGNSVNGDKTLWHSCFVSKRFPVDSGLLDGVVIREDIFNKRAKMNSLTNRAIDFKAMLASQDEKGIIKRIGERIGNRADVATGRVRGFRAGATFDPNAVDADMDGFVQEGTQFARPAIPGVNTDVSVPSPSVDKPTMEAPKRGKLGSFAKNLKSTVRQFHWFNPQKNDERYKTRWIDRSSKVIDAEFNKQEKMIADLYNDGKSIATVEDAKNVIRRINPKIKIDFIEAAQDDSEQLSDFNKSLFLGYMYGIHVSPQLKNVDIKIRENLNPDDNSGGSQILMTGIFIANGSNPFQVDRDGPNPITGEIRDTRQHMHQIEYAGQTRKASQIRSGRFNPKDPSQWQPGTFEETMHDITGLRVAAAYLFEDDEDPDYKKLLKLASEIEGKQKKVGPDASPTEELQKEYEILKQLFNSAMSKIPQDTLQEKIQKAEVAMARSVAIHEMGHAGHTEAAFQDALVAAAEARDKWVAKYEKLHTRMDELKKIFSNTNDPEERKKLLEEAASINEELSLAGHDMTTKDYLQELKLAQGEELFPFYAWHQLNGGDDPIAQRKIAESIQDMQAAAIIGELMVPYHGGIITDMNGEWDLSAYTWLDGFRRVLQENLIEARQKGDMYQAQAIASDLQKLDLIEQHIKQKIMTPLVTPVRDKSGKTIPLTPGLASVLRNLRNQTNNTKNRHAGWIQVLTDNGLTETKIGDPVTLFDLLDFVSLGSLMLSRRNGIELGRDAEFGPSTNLMDPDFNNLWSSTNVLRRQIATNFEEFSYFASPAVRTKMTEAIKRLGLIDSENNKHKPIGAIEDPYARVSRLVDAASIADTFAGVEVPNPLDIDKSAATAMIDEYLRNVVDMIGGDRTKRKGSKEAAAILTSAVIARHSYDDLTNEEREIAMRISKFGSGTAFAGYLGLIQPHPIVATGSSLFGDHRVELFSELAVINALQLSLYSADRDYKTGALRSRHLDERERAVLRKLLAWYQSKAAFSIGSSPLPKDR